MERAPPPALLPRHAVLALSLSFSTPPFLFSHTECVSRLHTHVRARFVHVYARAFVSFPPSYGRGSETAPLRAHPVGHTRGVTASFGWVRAKETDENRAGMRETRSRERTGRWGRGVCQISTEVSAPCDFASAGTVVFLLPAHGRDFKTH